MPTVPHEVTGRSVFERLSAIHVSVCELRIAMFIFVMRWSEILRLGFTFARFTGLSIAMVRLFVSGRKSRIVMRVLMVKCSVILRSRISFRWLIFCPIVT